MSWMDETDEDIERWIEDQLEDEEELPPSVCWVLRELDRIGRSSVHHELTAEAKTKMRLAAMFQHMDKMSDFVSSETEQKVEKVVELHVKEGCNITVVELFHQISESTGYEYNQLVQVYPAVLNKMIANKIIFKDWYMGKYYIRWICKNWNFFRGVSKILVGEDVPKM